MQKWFGAPVAALAVGIAANAQAGDGHIYGLQPDSAKNMYQIDVTGAFPTITLISKNAQPWQASSTLARDPLTGAVYFTNSAAPSDLAAFDPALSTLNGGSNNCVTSPDSCQILIGGSGSNPQLAGRLEFRDGAATQLFGVAQNLANRPIELIDHATGVASLFGYITVGGVLKNTGAGGDHTFNQTDINCPIGLMPPGSMFIVPNVANPALWMIHATEFDDCINLGECNLEMNTVTSAIIGMGAARPTGLGFDQNTNPSFNGGRPRLWSTWNDQTLVGIDPCTGTILAGTGVRSQTQIADLTNEVAPKTGFTIVGCSSVEGASAADLLVLGLIPLFFFRRRRSA
ncbi:MAG: hypothetical protein HYV07_30985 [Deltaproteobacteria bacterium]|nr:hypothetical protein [Deltaproteobacteria bacterium]